MSEGRERPCQNSTIIPIGKEESFARSFIKYQASKKKNSWMSQLVLGLVRSHQLLHQNSPDEAVTSSFRVNMVKRD
jgi:hypothetical protein